MATRTADSLFDALILDIFPTSGACVDFGLDSGNVDAKYAALQRVVRSGQVTADQLHEAAGDGKAITKLVDQGVKYDTAYDMF